MPVRLFSKGHLGTTQVYQCKTRFACQGQINLRVGKTNNDRIGFDQQSTSQIDGSQDNDPRPSPQAFKRMSVRNERRPRQLAVGKERRMPAVHVWIVGDNRAVAFEITTGFDLIG